MTIVEQYPSDEFGKKKKKEMEAPPSHGETISCCLFKNSDKNIITYELMLEVFCTFFYLHTKIDGYNVTYLIIIKHPIFGRNICRIICFFKFVISIIRLLLKNYLKQFFCYKIKSMMSFLNNQKFTEWYSHIPMYSFYVVFKLHIIICKTTSVNHHIYIIWKKDEFNI
uniref:Uncharacterized protein n=1 Tax=Heterorhabditis bacteriophora TaxID=37862 RepID=A0A1I7X0V4_HETBA